MTNQPYKTLSQFPFGVYAHSFNKDKSQVAISPNSHKVYIYQVKDYAITNLLHTLSEHNLLVSSIDWAPKSNRIVTCSHDKTAYVWNYVNSENKWKPTLVHLRFDRAALFVRWSPFENKFAVASSRNLVAICYFGEENDWYVSKHLKKNVESTVFTLDWHKDNILLCTASTDMKAKIFSTYIKGVDEKPEPNEWGNKFPFNQLFREYTSEYSGWVHDCKFSPSGDAIAFCAHDSTVNIVYANTNHIHSIESDCLPFVRLLWINNTQIAVSGHDCNVVVYEGGPNNEWKFVKKYDKIKEKGKLLKSEGERGSTLAFNKFKQMDTHGYENKNKSEDESESEYGNDIETSAHANCISEMRAFEKQNNSVHSISTSALDGRLIVWEVAE